MDEQQNKNWDELTNEELIERITGTMRCYDSRTLIELVWVTILHYEDNVMPKELETGGV